MAPYHDYFQSHALFFCSARLKFLLVRGLKRKLPKKVEHQAHSPWHLSAMTRQERKRLSSVLRATEYLFLENIALKLVLDHRQVPQWQKLVDRLLDDKEMLAGVHLKFRDVYEAVERSSDPNAALESFLGELPSRRKEH
jgi:hypothetical protein